MAAKARARSRDFSRQFWPTLWHAFSECCLITMLIVIAVVSFTATRFARICRLRSPCILCSRLDRILHGKSWFSEELVCAAHRFEISHLSYCQSHNKLAHSDDLCERCLLSCAGLVGKHGNLTNMGNKDNLNPRSRSRHTHRCSCCSEMFKKAHNAHRLSDLAKASVPDDDRSKLKDRIIVMESVGHSSDDSSDNLSCGGYRKLHVHGDSESETHFSGDDDHVKPMPHKVRQITKEFSSDDLHLQPMISKTNTMSMHPVNAAKPLDYAIGHGLEEINWSQVNVSGNNHGVQSKIVPEQNCEELRKEKRSHNEEATKDFAASANTGTSSSSAAYINRNNSMENASDGRDNIQSPRWSEIISAKDTSSIVQEEVNTFQNSARGFDGPWGEDVTSPRIDTDIDDYRQSDDTWSGQILDMNNSNTETSDVSGDEGESSIECLKQKVKHGKRKTSILYNELEAERSASAVAASEAMAMINRLQQEKASMHMEALQYLRMMEEQADHDQEALEKINDLLTEREKEVLDLESELENYRSVLCDEPFDIGKFDATDGHMEFGDFDGSDFMKDTMFDFEDEKTNILESLSRLEETLGMSSTSRPSFGGTNENLHNRPQLPHEHNGESVSSQQNDENQHVEFDSCSRLDDDKNISLTIVKHEISLLNTRFKALEADQKFLKQILSFLKCSNDGVQYVHEITSHLRELRRIVTEQRQTEVL